MQLIGYFLAWQNETYILYFLPPLLPVQKTFLRHWIWKCGTSSNRARCSEHTRTRSWCCFY